MNYFPRKLIAILSEHYRLLPNAVQIVLFSATFPDHVVHFAGRFAPGANQITLAHEELTVEGIKQLYLNCANEADKYDSLVKLYGLMTIGSSIIFVRVGVIKVSFSGIADVVEDSRDCT